MRVQMVQLSVTIICISTAIWGCSARIYTKSINAFYNVDSVVQAQSVAQAHSLMEKGFGFQANGDVKFSMNCMVPEPLGSPDFWLLFCSAADAREFSRMTPRQVLFDCVNGLSREFPRVEGCKRHLVEHNTSHNDGQYSFYKRMDHSAFYTMILLQCPSPSNKNNNSTEINVLHCQSKLVTLNPGGTQLSSDEIPLPLIYTVINLIWATLMAGWFFNWVIYFKFSNRLHRLISCAPIFKVILVVLILLWWQEIANTGVESTDICTLKEFVQSIEDALLFMTQMMIAEGWGVVRSHIKHYRWTSLLMLFAVFSTSLMCVYWVHKYFLAFSVCCVVFMMYKTLKWSSHNIELLRRRRRKIRRFIARHNLRYKGSVTIDKQLCQKLNIYHKFRIICASFSMVYAIARTLATFLHEYSYIRALTFELPELLVYLAIGFLFRLRNFEPYENIELVPPRENVVVFELPDVCVNEVQPHVVLGVPLHFKVEKETQTPRRRWRTVKSQM